MRRIKTSYIAAGLANVREAPAAQAMLLNNVENVERLRNGNERYVIAIGRLVYSNERNSQNCESAAMQLSVSRREVNYFGGL